MQTAGDAAIQEGNRRSHPTGPVELKNTSFSTVSSMENPATALTDEAAGILGPCPSGIMLAKPNRAVFAASTENLHR